MRTLDFAVSMICVWSVGRMGGAEVSPVTHPLTPRANILAIFVKHSTI